MAKQKMRAMSVIIIIVDCLFGLWLMSGAMAASRECGSATYREACNTGATIGLGIVIVIAAAVNVVLGVLWFITKPAPTQMAPGPTRPMPGRPVPGWYPDPVNAGRLAWWDGSGWSFESTQPTALLSQPRRPNPPVPPPRPVAPKPTDNGAPIWSTAFLVVCIVGLVMAIIIALSTRG